MATSIPQIFVSTTTDDLTACRLRIVDAVSRQRCYAASQHHFAPNYKEVYDALREAVSACDAMIHIVGECYGNEPRKRAPDEPRQSYTQMECAIARELNIPVFLFICKLDFPYQKHPPETAEKKKLQQAYRKRLMDDEDNLYLEVGTPEEVEIKVIEAIQGFKAQHEKTQRDKAAAAAATAAATAAANAAVTASLNADPDAGGADGKRSFFARVPAWAKSIPPIIAAVAAALAAVHFTRSDHPHAGTTGGGGGGGGGSVGIGFVPPPNWQGPRPQIEWTVPDLGANGLRMKWIPEGEFFMGSPETEPDRDPDETRHKVRISRPFWLGETEVTQAQYAAIMGVNPAVFRGAAAAPAAKAAAGAGTPAAGEGAAGATGSAPASAPAPAPAAAVTADQLPVEYVSWGDAFAFCKKLTEREHKAGRLPPGYAYTLPTDAEWEYACRAGTTTPYAGSGNLDDMGWHWKNSERRTHPVAKKKANAWGLFDMHGNVWEWCLDYSDTIIKSNATDPVGEISTATHHFIRGGGYFDVPRKCRSAFHDWNAAGDRYLNIGFRLALTTTGATAE
ncbi:MAG: SUMF1/EgtB/PvdO family nonheme iron enzyme [Puniceicoccales bacterium]|nr:SUMF1/EgtB/PvdO family nonheme iron enzyme [Puniceicoccales bacterium]